MNIALIGFMGTGKTTVGKKLASRLNYKFVDLDQEIVAEDGREICEIFAQAGEDYFRDLETRVTAKIAQKDKQVIATGGGVVLREENIKNLKKNGFLVLLQATPEEILERTKSDDDRPLLDVEEPLAKIKKMLEERAEKYNCTPYQINTTGLTINEVVAEIINNEELTSDN
ncbi:shikimate kinase [Halobacteroides halobius DSM 5150]|uniref:Shikimate kinase n=1 Tax=Halobacteroides halobius (strain ATCC 35273 / DSM 5150 / MD-1) TaxID=748449 RepID=L0K656_HALHC|nr:shikimate kinase [Halobacteroides halobius]AGB40501.1 shikimate kinase [Halobacteroides halobius DSM 5150]